MRADKVGSDTLVAQIVRMVSEAQRSRAPIQRVADQGVFLVCPCGHCLRPSITFVVWALRAGAAAGLCSGQRRGSSHHCVSLRPGLATPMSIMVGMGRGARAGVLIRNAEALELLEKVDTLVVDKTGTLTEGKPKLASMATAGMGRERNASPCCKPGTRKRTRSCRLRCMLRRTADCSFPEQATSAPLPARELWALLTDIPLRSGTRAPRAAAARPRPHAQEAEERGVKGRRWCFVRLIGIPQACWAFRILSKSPRRRQSGNSTHRGFASSC